MVGKLYWRIILKSIIFLN